MPPAPDPDPEAVPEFLREALEADTDARAALDSLGELLPRARSGAGAARLLAEVERLPLRYAPFFDRLAALWDLSELEVRAVLERSADPGAWRKPLLPGIALFEFEGGPRADGARVKLARFAPGLRFPPHRHQGHEAVLVLEGSYTDSFGRFVGPGDLQEMTAGSEHALSIARREPCVAALVEHGVEFTGVVLRTLQRWFDR